MDGGTPLDFLPLWAVFALTALIVLLSDEGGYRLGRFRRSRSAEEKEAPVGAMAGATLGLLAFLLAFTFGLAATRFDARRRVVVDEANAIGTTYLRAEFLPAPNRDAVRNLLRDYVDLRLETVRSGTLHEGVQRSEELHRQLWAQAAAAGQKNHGSILVGLFVQSLNEVIDLHSKRLFLGPRSRLPATIWLTLYVVAILSLASMGYHAGLAGTTRSVAIIPVALAFSVVIVMIADLDRPQQGWMRVSQQALTDVRSSMTEPQP